MKKREELKKGVEIRFDNLLEMQNFSQKNKPKKEGFKVKTKQIFILTKVN
ncbi:hypothetical protein [Tenacibaculum maritimum]|nr:hypothetical protein [Tenacibaculum maritimum]MCD9582305.1 hypothetical protein [Tenacibaculum maritimum]MCD9636687.1 hypothetical protein [Tenacibaculum maritimum]